MAKRSLTTPQLFLDAFLKSATENKTELVDLWNQAARYTGLMRGVILPRAAAVMQINSWPRDYYTLDSIFFIERDTQNFGEHATFAKHIEVAIEHENFIAGTPTEINKLQLFNSPLKVLITYGNDADQQQYLRIYHEMIGWADVFDDISSLRRQLVIFGQKTPSDDDVVWTAYVYDSAGFIRL
jgi:hypothetical protein